MRVSLGQFGRWLALAALATMVAQPAFAQRGMGQGKPRPREGVLPPPGKGMGPGQSRNGNAALGAMAQGQIVRPASAQYSSLRRRL